MTSECFPALSVDNQQKKNTQKTPNVSIDALNANSDLPYTDVVFLTSHLSFECNGNKSKKKSHKRCASRGDNLRLRYPKTCGF